jgi:hypothetical protein
MFSSKIKKIKIFSLFKTVVNLIKHVKFKLCTSQNFKDDTENNIEPSMISHKTTGERIEKRNRQVSNC